MDNSQYLLGYSKIDNDHKKLFALIDQMTEAMSEHRDSEEHEKIINGLFDYAATHFQLERGLMEEYNYSGLEEHLASHGYFTREVTNIKSNLKENPVALSISMLKLLRKWLYEHIMVHDKRMVDFLLQNQKN